MIVIYSIILFNFLKTTLSDPANFHSTDKDLHKNPETVCTIRFPKFTISPIYRYVHIFKYKRKIKKRKIEALKYSGPGYETNTPPERIRIREVFFPLRGYKLRKHNTGCQI